MRNLFHVLLFTIFFTASASSAEVKVSTLNSWGIPWWGENREARFSKIGEISKKYDILGLQEVFMDGDHIIKALAPHQKHIYPEPQFPWISPGLMVVSKLPIHEKNFYRFDGCGGGQCLVDRGLLHAVVEFPGKILVDVFNIHFQAYDYYREVREAQIKKVWDKMSSLFNKGRPSLIMGDFNVIAGSEEFKALKKLFKGFVDVWEVAGNGPGYTWNPDKNPYTNHEGESKVYQRLDYILVRDGERTGWKIKNVVVDFSSGENILSDHFGVTASLKLETKN